MKLIKKIFKNLVLLLFLPFWHIQRFIPRNKNLWIFGSWSGKKYSDNSKFLFEYVNLHCSNIKAIWITKSDEVYKELKKTGRNVYYENSIKGIFSCFLAKYAFLSNGAFDVNPYFLNGCKEIWLWHGMPLKKIGYLDDSQLNCSKIKRFFLKVFKPFYQMNPYCTLTSADFFTDFLSKSFKLPYDKIWNTGLPRCDAFFSSIKDPYIEQLKCKYENSSIFIYMPTFRMSSSMTGSPFNPFITEYGFYEKEFIDFLEKNNILFLYKPHFVDRDVKVSINSDRFIFLDDSMFTDLYILLNSVDCLITDYSSVFFDFIATKKDIYLLPFDYEEYKIKSRGHFFNMYEEMNGIVSYSWRDFYNSVNSRNLINSDCNLNEKFIQYVDGFSCKKIVDKILNLG